MGLPVGAVSPLAWMVLKQEAAGAHLAILAAELGVSHDDLLALKDATTQLKGDDSETVWQRGVVALKTAAIMNANVGQTWDAVESMAVEKLANGLSAMKGNGNAAEMLAIATAANKAARRNRGESSGSPRTSTHIHVPGGSGGEVELSSGNLGRIHLRLAPAIQAQLSNPARVIDHVSKQPAGKINEFQMLGLNDTRKLVKPEVIQPDPNMDFDPEILDNGE